MPSESGNNGSLQDSPSTSRSTRLVARICGYFLVLVFFGLTATSGGLWVAFPFPFSASTVGELRLWLASAVLLFPASCLLGLGYAPDVAPLLRRVWSWCATLEGRRWLVALAVLGIGLAIVFRAGNFFILHDYPITDDEYAAQFGGRILATGRLMVPLLQPSEAIPIRFLFVRDGLVTAQDFVGVLAAWALAGITRLGPFLFALFAALPVVSVAVIVGKRIGRAWVLLGVAILVLSPMSLALSLTTHSHVLSRGLIALALCLYVVAQDSPRPLYWVMCGVCIGASFTCRPFETAFLVAPFAAYELWHSVSNADARRCVLFTLLGAAPFAVAFLAYSAAVTGNPLLPPKFAPGSNRGNLGQFRLWKSFGSNMSQNIFLVATWFLGPLGIVLVAFGALVDRFSRLVAISFASVLVLSLLHLDTGIHIVGPIHYSETVVPLSVLAVYGARELKRRAGELGLAWDTPAAIMAFALVVGLGLFSLVHGFALERQASIQADIYGEINRSIPADARKAVLLTPEFDTVRNTIFAYVETGSWVFTWRRPQPAYDDDILILLDKPGVEEAMRARFPDRRFFRVTLPQSGGFAIEPISGT